MIVMKFGGTSVEDAKSMQTVIQIVRKEQSRQPIVVLSAIAGATNTLLKAARTAQEGKLDEAILALNNLLDRHVTVMENLIDDRTSVQQLIAVCQTGALMNCVISATALQFSENLQIVHSMQLLRWANFYLRKFSVKQCVRRIFP